MAEEAGGGRREAGERPYFPLKELACQAVPPAQCSSIKYRQEAGGGG